jgi:hypothetical protein
MTRSCHRAKKYANYLAYFFVPSVNVPTICTTAISENMNQNETHLFQGFGTVEALGTGIALINL